MKIAVVQHRLALALMLAIIQGKRTHGGDHVIKRMRHTTARIIERSQVAGVDDTPIMAAPQNAAIGTALGQHRPNRTPQILQALAAFNTIHRTGTP